MLTVRAAASALGVCSRVLKEAIREGVLPRPAGFRTYDWAVLPIEEAWIAEVLRLKGNADVAAWLALRQVRIAPGWRPRDAGKKP